LRSWGSLLAGLANPDLLKLVLGVGLIGIAVAFLRHPDEDAEDAAIDRGEGVVEPNETHSITARDGTVFDYAVCRQGEGRAFSGAGGLFVGLISTGLGELNSYALLKRCRVPSRITVATSVVVVAVTALAASVTHLLDFAREGGDAIDTVVSLVVFTVPGVIIGGQLGPRVTARIPGDRLLVYLGWLFLLIGIITIAEAVIG
jgi:hypothetical protein